MADLFASPTVLAQGALTGFLFGFLLQRGRVTRHDTIVGQFRLKDFTVLKVMFTAIVVTAAGILLLPEIGIAMPEKVKAAQIFAVLVGATLFGVGMTVLGYCPGTGVAALGDGSRDVAFGIIGMLVGAALYAEAHPSLSSWLHEGMDLGKVTLPDVTGMSGFVWLGLLVVIWGVLFALLRHHEPADAPARES